MELAILAGKLLLILVPIIWSIICWANSKDRKVEILRARIREWERKEADALAKDDVAALNYARGMLDQLRKDAGVLRKR